ncbi:Tubulin-folding cofactor C [Metarhizium anisopliae]
MDPKQKFYRHFQDSVAELQEQIDELEAVSAVAGERQEAIDHVLAGISKLQHEFKRSSIGAHVDMGAPENDPRLHPGSLSRNTQSSSGEKHQEARESDDTVGDLPSVAAIRDYNAELSQPSTQFVRKPSFSMARNIGIANQSHLHIILPSSAARATASGSLTDLKWCIVDMSVPTAQGKPFPGLALRNISNSLIVAGHVNGPVHITGVADSIIVVTARQVRIHECKNVDIYLHCTSHPIIEDCTGMRFAQLPKCYVSVLYRDLPSTPQMLTCFKSIEGESPKENQWDQVDDFKWLKAGQSPNWTTLSDAEALDEALWTNVVPGQPGVSVEETLKKVDIPRQ